MSQKTFDEFYSLLPEKDEHKQSKEYKKLSPKMKNAVDSVFSVMDKKPNDFLRSFEKVISDTARKYRVPEKEILKYFEKETLSVL